MHTPIGLKAYQTYLGLSLHFRRGAYNGWDYNFNGKVKAETFEANRSVVHRYASLETKYPSKNEQIKFFYPAFAKFGYVKSDAIACFTKLHRNFAKSFGDLVEGYFVELKDVASEVSSIDELLGVVDNLPFVYNCYIEKLITYDSLIFLSLAIPSLNKVVSNEPFLWNSLLEKIKFDSKFYALYLNSDTKTLEDIKQNTIAVLMSAWKLKYKEND